MTGGEESAGDAASDPITTWVGAARRGDREAAESLYRAVYGELRRIAHAQRRRLRPSETLSTTVLVSELYLRLARAAPLPVADRHHFFSLAARITRQILIDGARRTLAARHGGGADLAPLEGERDFIAPERPAELLALDEALQRLAAVDEELARVVELHFFAGLSFEQMAESSTKSERTLRREWRRARAFLYDFLSAAG
jgi:RNA polymerase sigma factor (TIGR02999 family)